MISNRIFAASRRSLLVRRSTVNPTASLNSNQASFSTVTDTSDNSNYVSPFKNFFEMMEKGDNFGALDFPDKETKYLKCGIAEDSLRFRTSHYGRLQLAPHVQPWEHRVTVRVGLKDMPIDSALERQLLTDIVGVGRMNGETLQLSSNQFGSRIENKRHLVSMLDRIVLGAKRLAKEIEGAAPEQQAA